MQNMRPSCPPPSNPSHEPGGIASIESRCYSGKVAALLFEPNAIAAMTNPTPASRAAPSAPTAAS